MELARSGEGHPTASCRWLGHRPEGPGAEPLRNDFTPFRMADSGSLAGNGTGPGGRTGGETEGVCSASPEGLQGRD